MERGDVHLFNEQKKLINDQELTSGDYFEFKEKKEKNEKVTCMGFKKKSIDVPRGLPYTVNTAASVNV